MLTKPEYKLLIEKAFMNYVEIQIEQPYYQKITHANLIQTRVMYNLKSE